MSFRNILPAFVIFLFSSCQDVAKAKVQVEGPAGYNWQQPEKISLSEELDEISGIYFDAERNSIIAVNDEQGLLFSISMTDKTVQLRSRFNKGGDYEDVLFAHANPYALKSNGDVFKILNPFTDSVTSVETKLKLKGKNDFEAMLFDSSKNRLLVFCKNCISYPDSPAVFSYNLQTEQFEPEPAFMLIVDSTYATLLNKKNKLQLSAAAVHPKTGEWFLIASANHLLLITDSDGKIKAVYPLNKKLFKQAEGICFAPNGDLYISNEAKNGIANILKFSFTN